MKKFVFIILLLSFSTLVFAKPYPVKFKIMCQNPEKKEKLEKKISDLIKRYDNLTLSNNKNKRDPTVAKMWVYALEFKESNKNNKIWTFLVAHTSHLPIRALVMEVFKEGNTSSKNLKEITLNLFSNKGGILKYLNLSIVDDFKKSDEIMEKFVHHFSERIVKY